jgi:alpha-N-arabinofuranosidase
MESLVADHWTAMAESDPTHKVKLLVDEWGTWHAGASDMPPNYLWAYPGTLRDARVAALTLDTFNRHADKIAMANVAQLVNTIHSLCMAHEDRFIVTPNFHVFAMYAVHQGATAVRTVFSAPEISMARQGRTVTLWGLGASASMRDKMLTVTVVNPHATVARECAIAVRGAAVKNVEATTLSSTDPRAHDSFEAPNTLAPRAGPVARRAGEIYCCDVDRGRSARAFVTMSLTSFMSVGTWYGMPSLIVQSMPPPCTVFTLGSFGFTLLE